MRKRRRSRRELPLSCVVYALPYRLRGNVCEADPKPEPQPGEIEPEPKEQVSDQALKLARGQELGEDGAPRWWRVAGGGASTRMTGGSGE
ncbi:hypothetical protein CGRA01v4_06093 [Colletotrichum graminicola]|nr:hypothetical protein CGRA01v4_06093 [Colletotrichum graminicola]